MYRGCAFAQRRRRTLIMHMIVKGHGSRSERRPRSYLPAFDLPLPFRLPLDLPLFLPLPPFLPFPPPLPFEGLSGDGLRRAARSGAGGLRSRCTGGVGGRRFGRRAGRRALVSTCGRGRSAPGAKLPPGETPEDAAPPAAARAPSADPGDPPAREDDLPPWLGDRTLLATAVSALYGTTVLSPAGGSWTRRRLGLSHGRGGDG